MSAACKQQLLPCQRGCNGRFNERAFTLLEVIVAMAILALGLTVIAQAQQLSMRQVTHSKSVTVATLLAREKMMEVEDRLFDQGTSEFDEEEEGDFAEQGFKPFGFRLKVDKIEIPTALDAEALKSAMSGSSGTSATGGAAASTAARGPTAGALGSSMITQQMDLFRKVLEQSIRRVTLTVVWKEGRAERSVKVAAYFTDTRKVDQVLGGGLLSAAAAASGALGSGTTQGVGTTTGGGTTGTTGSTTTGTSGGLNRTTGGLR